VITGRPLFTKILIVTIFTANMPWPLTKTM